MNFKTIDYKEGILAYLEDVLIDANGFFVDDSSCKEGEVFYIKEDEIAKCHVYVSRLKTRITINPNYGSYGLKHRVEQYLKLNNLFENPYVSNGAFITSMLMHGFKCKRDRLNSRNCEFNLDTKSVEAL
jgi:hypothetical protein